MKGKDAKRRCESPQTSSRRKSSHGAGPREAQATLLGDDDERQEQHWHRPAVLTGTGTRQTEQRVADATCEKAHGKNGRRTKVCPRPSASPAPTDEIEASDTEETASPLAAGASPRGAASGDPGRRGPRGAARSLINAPALELPPVQVRSDSLPV